MASASRSRQGDGGDEVVQRTLVEEKESMVIGEMEKESMDDQVVEKKELMAMIRGWRRRS
eukprot:6302290-Pyramimonas_sp.AAC.1